MHCSNVPLHTGLWQEEILLSLLNEGSDLKEGCVLCNSWIWVDGQCFPSFSYQSTLIWNCRKVHFGQKRRLKSVSTSFPLNHVVHPCSFWSRCISFLWCIIKVKNGIRNIGWNPISLTVPMWQLHKDKCSFGHLHSVCDLGLGAQACVHLLSALAGRVCSSLQGWVNAEIVGRGRVPLPTSIFYPNSLVVRVLAQAVEEQHSRLSLSCISYFPAKCLYHTTD